MRGQFGALALLLALAAALQAPPAQAARMLLDKPTVLLPRPGLHVPTSSASDAAAPADSDATHIGAAPGASFRIVNGEASPNQNRFPYQLGFEPRVSEVMCGASLIRRDVAVTAAHCVPKVLDDDALSEMAVYAGADLNFLIDDSGAAKYGVRGAVRHPDFDLKSNRNDIALLFLDQCVELRDDVQPIKLATAAELAAALNSTWMVSGWGTTEIRANRAGKDGILPELLQYAYVKHIDQEQCAADLGRVLDGELVRKVLDGDTALCAGGLPAEREANAAVPLRDACQGDSGGPLVLNLGNKDEPERGRSADDRLVGVVSMGIGCGKRRSPTVYAKAPAYSKWIESKLKAEPMDCNLLDLVFADKGDGDGDSEYDADAEGSYDDEEAAGDEEEAAGDEEEAAGDDEEAAADDEEAAGDDKEAAADGEEAAGDEEAAADGEPEGERGDGSGEPSVVDVIEVLGEVMQRLDELEAAINATKAAKGGAQQAAPAPAGARPAHANSTEAALAIKAVAAAPALVIDVPPAPGAHGPAVQAAGAPAAEVVAAAPAAGAAAAAAEPARVVSPPTRAGAALLEDAKPEAASSAARGRGGPQLLKFAAAAAVVVALAAL